ncbi:MAG: Hsp20/alpha crystallin family protein [Candidatus Woesearchaeota archaeon]|nr:Hsp20/alpha crystallin family protein [Candidatus Woesearchaeota archaeon]
MDWSDWSIFDEMKRMREEMDRLFEEFFNRKRQLIEHKGKKEERGIMSYRSPVTNVYETENSVVAAIELPGVEKNDIELNVTENMLEVKAERKLEKEIKKKGVYSYSSAARSFYRSFTLPAKVDASKAKAEYKNGILRVEMPKIGKGKEEKKRIDIE